MAGRSMPIARPFARRIARFRERLAERKEEQASTGGKGDSFAGFKKSIGNFFSSLRFDSFRRKAASLIGENFLNAAYVGLSTIGARGAAGEFEARGLNAHLGRLVDEASSAEADGEPSAKRREDAIKAVAKFLNDKHAANKVPAKGWLLARSDDAFKRAFYDSLAATNNVYYLEHLQKLSEAAQSPGHHALNVFSLISRSMPSSSNEDVSSLISYLPEWPKNQGKLRLKVGGREQEVDLRQAARNAWVHLEGFADPSQPAGAGFTDSLRALSENLQGEDKKWAQAILKRRGQVERMFAQGGAGQAFNLSSGFKIGGQENTSDKEQSPVPRKVKSPGAEEHRGGEKPIHKQEKILPEVESSGGQADSGEESVGESPEE